MREREGHVAGRQRETRGQRQRDQGKVGKKARREEAGKGEGEKEGPGKEQRRKYAPLLKIVKIHHRRNQGTSRAKGEGSQTG